MTIQTIARAPSNGIIALKGAGKAKREAAYISIAPLAMVDTMGRTALISALRDALGNKPTEAETKAAQQEVTIGRVAARLPASEFPKGCTDNASKLEHVRLLVCNYAAPVQDGKKPRALRAGQLGRRSILQHKAIRAADEAWSQIKAELGLSAAQTQKERDALKKTRAPHGKVSQVAASTVSQSGKKGSAKPTHSELVQPAKPMTADDATNHVSTQAALLASYANKYAKVLPADFGTAVLAFKGAINKAMNDYALAKAAADAKRAETEK